MLRGEIPILRSIFHPLTITAFVAASIVLLMFIFPTATLEASLRGLAIWWEVLFPALFPFFVISELMLGFGIVHFFGKLLDPLMRPLFRLPGIGGFVVTMGYISGYPVGARLTAQLYEQGLVNRREGERLVSFTTTSDPIFLIGAVAVGFFQQIALAPIMSVAHYFGAFIIGLLMRFHDRKSEKEEENKPNISNVINKHSYKPARLTQAIRAMHEARLLDGRAFPVILQQAVQSALRLMIVVGGLVVFFSVALELLTHANVLHLFIVSLQFICTILGLSPALAEAIIPGIFEVTLGAQSASLINTPLIHQAAIAVWILSWGGLSVHAQVASLLSHTPIRYKPLFFARLAHAFISMLLVYLLWGWLGPA